MARWIATGAVLLCMAGFHYGAQQPSGRGSGDQDQAALEAQIVMAKQSKAAMDMQMAALKDYVLTLTGAFSGDGANISLTNINLKPRGRSALVNIGSKWRRLCREIMAHEGQKDNSHLATGDVDSIHAWWHNCAAAVESRFEHVTAAKVRLVLELDAAKVARSDSSMAAGAAARDARVAQAQAARYRRMVLGQIGALEAIVDDTNATKDPSFAEQLLVFQQSIDLTGHINATHANDTLEVSDLRYFSVVDTSQERTAWRCPGCGPLLFFARRSARGIPGALDVLRTTTIWLFSQDSAGALEPMSTLQPVSPWPVVADYAFASNFDALLVHGALYAVGGHHFTWDEGHGFSKFGRFEGRRLKPRDGIHLINSTRLKDVVSGKWQSWQEDMPKRHHYQAETDSRARSLILTGRHPGCREQYIKYSPVCYFDSKLSVAYFRGRFLIYVRANMFEGGGGRFVQATQSLGGNLNGPFGPFQLLNISGYDTREQVLQGNIYTAIVRPHPLDEDVLIGLFSVNLGLKNRRGPGSNGEGFIALSLSCDGVNWSRFTRLMSSSSEKGRNYDQPAAGLVLREGDVHFFVHRDVPMISPRANTKSRLERYSFRKKELMRLTEAVKRSELCLMMQPGAPVNTMASNESWFDRQPHRQRRVKRARTNQAGDTAKTSAPPCCPKAPNEPSRRGRCSWMASNGKCDDRKFARNYCPVACGSCTVCADHPEHAIYADFYERLRAQGPTAMIHANIVRLNKSSIGRQNHARRSRGTRRSQHLRRNG